MDGTIWNPDWKMQQRCKKIFKFTLACKMTRITQVWPLTGSVRFVVLSSLLTKSIMKDLRSLVWWLETYFSHGIGVYSCIFGTYPSAQWFLYYTNRPYQGIIALCRTYVYSSTQYSSYRIHVGISIPMAAMCQLHPSYGIYMQSMLIPTIPTYHGLSSHTMLIDH